jgi:hypothetical protein
MFGGREVTTMRRIVRENSYQQNLQKIVDLFNSMEIEYMVVGGGALVLHGFDYHTNDVDFYFQDTEENKIKIVEALDKLGFRLNQKSKQEILGGKDFIIQTLERWGINRTKTVEERIRKGIR